MNTPSNKLREDALNYHAKGRPGKIEVNPTKETENQRDLSLAYSPGVAEPCLAIADVPERAYDYTAKGNLVAVISNGTAVLGLGNIGAVASKPVMEGKSLLFKIYADIDAFDIELDTTDVEEFIRTVKILEPTFGGVNLEDIKAPECFEIERRLRQELNIPVMHDDQHGTAITSGAALLNALELAGKEIDQIKLVVNGAGAAAIACLDLYVDLGVSPDNITVFDKDGLLSKDRTNLVGNQYKYTTDRHPAGYVLADAMVGADVFLGLSVGGVVTQDMIRSMAPDPVVFAMANPNPEITYEDATAARPDIIMATGRSDFPNQVNNVLGFPYIFRGALDVRATEINEAMKLAAVRALAELAKKPVTDVVSRSYGTDGLVFGRTYILPKPTDPRLLMTVAPAVAKAAMDSGVARRAITDWADYDLQLSRRQGQDNTFIRRLTRQAQQSPKRIVFTDGENLTVLRAVAQVIEQRMAVPILIGNEAVVQRMLDDHNMDLGDVQIIDHRSPEQESLREAYAQVLYEKRKRKGLTLTEARNLMRDRNYFGSVLLEQGVADVLISGLTRNYPETLRPALQVIGRQPGIQKVSGMYVLLSRFGPLFLSDTTVNMNPTTAEIVEIAETTANAVRRLGIDPRIALLSYSTFGSATGDDAVKMQEATAILQKKHPDWVVDGEMQAHLPFNQELMQASYGFSSLADQPANVLIFPNLSASNIAYNLLKEIGRIEKIGPVLMGLRKPVHVLQLGSSVREVVNMVAIAVAD
ncbi:Malate dehydrogenase (oxaloacetate-decarboxylating) (NADP(+)), Phosphate acetyltransferase [Fibrella aestuarina BUZ 2]|uniref:Malate dehydrogenase (Oxaloacetate-decarboxylating) (NADP(+)), Phosphate acetyltransferase n=1 Tax=Fibrella aestuarina BUZ 2 TaxID=1166018 RepID=I0K9Y7_9BACT|nr:NADP-dependent malic enzyme [Fibrella aestuarina]CCH00940.1 Malate dehydrogenase (oxaloacetate-decarboxylating) (NADP(+)), Phosphate acetyltransferase [Fibrella aestuarina BUZ 2]